MALLFFLIAVAGLGATHFWQQHNFLFATILALWAGGLLWMTVLTQQAAKRNRTKTTNNFHLAFFLITAAALTALALVNNSQLLLAAASVASFTCLGCLIDKLTYSSFNKPLPLFISKTINTTFGIILLAAAAVFIPAWILLLASAILALLPVLAVLGIIAIALILASR